MHNARWIGLLAVSLFLFVSAGWIRTAAAEEPPKPSLTDLGFSEADLAPDLTLQAQLEKRTSMLKTHQTLGLITAAPVAATLVTGLLAGESSGLRNAHMSLMVATTGLYFTTAYFSIFAPKPDGIKDKGKTQIHRILAWIHFPAMLITPVLGFMAKNQRDNREGLHGVAKYHNVAAGTLALSYAAAMSVMIFNF